MCCTVFNLNRAHFEQLPIFTFRITISYKKNGFFTRNTPGNRLISNSFCPIEIIISLANNFVRCATNVTRKNCLNVNR